MNQAEHCSDTTGRIRPMTDDPKSQYAGTLDRCLGELVKDLEPAGHGGIDLAMFETSTIGKALMILGLAIAIVGGLVWLSQYLPANVRPFRLPGDIRIQRDGFTFYFPIMTSILISLLVSLLFWLFRK